jgi:hypothetical protein
MVSHQEGDHWSSLTYNPEMNLSQRLKHFQTTWILLRLKKMHQNIDPEIFFAWVQSGITLVYLALILFASSGVANAAPLRLAVFNFELIDTSLQGQMHGTKPEELQRLVKISEALRLDLGKNGRYEVLNLGPVAAKAANANLQACGGCDVSFARDIGADVAITGTVQKISELILNLNLYLRDANSGKAIASMSADIRGNTDESWLRGLNYLIRNRLPATLEKITQ